MSQAKQKLTAAMDLSASSLAPPAPPLSCTVLHSSGLCGVVYLDPGLVQLLRLGDDPLLPADRLRHLLLEGPEGPAEALHAQHRLVQTPVSRGLHSTQTHCRLSIISCAQ